MPNAADLGRDLATTHFEWKGSKVEVKYKPSLLTSKNLDSYDDEGYGLQKSIAEVVDWWDVTEKKGTKDVMFPLDVDRLRELPTPFLRVCLEAILSDGHDVGEAASNSSAGS